MSTSTLRPEAILDGRFVLLFEAGRGGMGSVYAARDRQTGAQVAVKLLHAELTDAHAVERFRREAAFLATLSHPGIVSYIAHGIAEDGTLGTRSHRPYLVMEWLTGEDLSRRLRSGPLSIAESLCLMRAAAAAIGSVHRAGIIHRDLKPSNLFLRGGRVDQVVVLDFGVARAASIGSPLTATNAFLGTPDYMAPEQARYLADLSPAADVFSLGCVLFECLIGRPPFRADHPAALLAKLLFDEAPPVRSLRPDVPPELDALVGQMLGKDPRMRPADGIELVRCLDELSASAPAASESWEHAVPAEIDPDPIEHELALVSVLVARDALAQEGAADALEELESSGAVVERLVDGTLVAVLMPSETATDQIAHAARCALRLRERLERARIAVATGRGALGHGLRVGDAIERAMALLQDEGAEPQDEPENDRASSQGAAAVRREVRLDEATAGLLDARFRVGKDGAGGPVLIGFSESAEEARPLFGRSTPFVGRERELMLLDALAEECLADSVVRAALLIGEPGCGKSRLRSEFVRRLRAAHSEVLCLSGRCEEVGNLPLRPLIQALHQMSGVTTADPLPERRSALRARLGRHLPRHQAAETLAVLEELCGVSGPGEAGTLPAQAAPALARLLRAECKQHPMILSLDDLHWAEEATVRLIEQLLGTLMDVPLFVLITARPELAERFPSLWRQRAVQEIRLAGLSRRASERLVTTLLSVPSGSPMVVSLVEQSGGNPLLLEELIRAAAAGRSSELPETVLAIVQARMAKLEHLQRRVLRAASVFGTALWPAGVCALLPGVAPAATMQALQELIAQDVLARCAESRYEGEPELHFRYPPLRTAAYGLLTQEERARLHLAAARFLESQNETDGALLAEHYQRAGQTQRAASLYLRAAERLFDGYDLDAALDLAERGLRCGAGGEVLGGLRALCARILFWRGQLERASELAADAAERLPGDSAAWFLAFCLLIAGASHRRDTQQLLHLLARLEAASPSSRALGAYAESGGLLSLMLAYSGLKAQAYELLARVSSRIEQGDLRNERAAVAAGARGWTLYARGRLQLLFEPDPWAALSTARHAVAAFEEISDLRCVVLARSLEVACLYALGEIAQAAPVLQDALALAEGLAEELPRGELLATCALGLAAQPGLVPGSEDAQRAAELSNRLLESPRSAPQHRGTAWCAAAWLGLASSDLARAEHAARSAVAEHASWPLHLLTSMAALITVLHRKGAVDQAVQAAGEALRALDVYGCAGAAAVPVRLAAAGALQAAGDPARAEALRTLVAQQLAGIAAGAPDAQARARGRARNDHLLRGSP